MSDQNQFDQYKQKLLHYWSLFLAACGRLWTKAKDGVGKYAAAVGRAGKQLVQKIASWMLLAKEKAEQLTRTAAQRQHDSGEPESAEESAAQEAVSEETAVEETVVEETVSETVEAEEIAADPVQTNEVLREPAAEPAETATRDASDWKSAPWAVKTAAVFSAIGAGVKFTAKWIRKLYKLFMAIPVIWFAVKFAMENMERLPEEVGLDIQSTGEFARMISRQEAVYWPLGITMFCLLLMFCSKKPILPWVISIFTLVLPWLIWLLNYYA